MTRKHSTDEHKIKKGWQGWWSEVTKDLYRKQSENLNWNTKPMIIS